MGTELEEKKNEVIERKKMKKRKKIIRITSVILFFVFVLSFWYYQVGLKRYTGYKVQYTVDMDSASESFYEQFCKRVIKYSKDGISLIDQKGESLWSETYSMKSPKIVKNDTYLVVADIGGNGVFLFNEKGKIEDYTMPYPICDIELSDQGVIGVVLEDEKTNYIQLYDKEGVQIVDFAMTIAQSGYPLDIGLSKDALNMVVSAIKLEGLETKNTMAFYNFSSVGQNANSNKYVGGFYYTDTIFPKVEFINNNTVCAFGDNKLIFYQVTNKPKSNPIEITVETEIRSVFSNDQYVGVVRKNETNSELGNYIVEVYNGSGRQVLHKIIDMEYQKVKFDKNDIILLGEYEGLIIRLNGNEKLKVQFKEGATDLLSISSREYLLVGMKNIKKIRLY